MRAMPWPGARRMSQSVDHSRSCWLPGTRRWRRPGVGFPQFANLTDSRRGRRIRANPPDGAKAQSAAIFAVGEARTRLSVQTTR